MARTPLLQSIRQLIREVQLSRATGVPVDELRELREQKRISRRDVIAGAVVGASAAMLPLPAMAKGQASVTIVGGGIAGLTCALHLRDKGFASTVYEASGRIGGRMFSNTSYWASNQVSEWCGELIDSGHRTIRSLASRFRLDLDNLLRAQPNNSSDTFFLNGGYYTKTQADADFRAIAHLVEADVNVAGYPTTFDSFTPAGAAFDHMSVYDWIESRIPGGHGSPLGELLDLAYAIEYGADTADQSSLNLLYLLGFQPTNNQLDIYGESDEKFHIRGGNQRLPEMIAGELNGFVNTAHRLVRLEKTSGGRYKCTFDRNGSSVQVTSDFVVLAIPFPVLAGIDTTAAGFDVLKRRAISDLGRGRNGKLHLQFASRGWNGLGPWPGKANGSSYSDTGYQVSWDVTRAQSGSPGILTLYSGGSRTLAMQSNTPFGTASNNKVMADAQQGLSELARVYPGLAWNGRATQSLPHLSPTLGLSYCYWRVGQATAFGGYEGAPQGGVYFCGEHTSLDFQGFMEGAASTGMEVGKKLAKLL